MDAKSDKSLRLFVNPFAVWTDLALKTGQAILASAHAAAVQSNPALRVAVIPTRDAPAPKQREAKRAARTRTSSHARASAPRAKARSKAKRRAKR